MNNEIRIFHYKYLQFNGIYWAILVGGRLHFVEKWTAHVPVQSQEHYHLTHPDHQNGEGNLPNFHILCYGKVEFLPNPELGRVQSAQIVPITP